MHILPTAIGEFLCHTGTRSLVRSSAVSDDCTIVRNLVDVLVDLVSGHPDRARQFLIRLCPGRGISRIQKRQPFAAVQTFTNFVDCDSCDFHSAFMALRDDTDITNRTYLFDAANYYSLNVVLLDRYSVALWPVNSLNVLEK